MEYTDVRKAVEDSLREQFILSDSDNHRYIIEKEEIISDINTLRSVFKKEKYFDNEILGSTPSLQLLRLFGIINHYDYYEVAYKIRDYYESRFDKYCKSYNDSKTNYNNMELSRLSIGGTINDILNKLIDKYEKCLFYQIDVDRDYVINRECIHILTRYLLEKMIKEN